MLLHIPAISGKVLGNLYCLNVVNAFDTATLILIIIPVNANFSFDRCRQDAEEGGEFRVKAPETLTVGVQGIVLLVKSFIVIRMNEPSEAECEGEFICCGRRVSFY